MATTIPICTCSYASSHLHSFQSANSDWRRRTMPVIIRDINWEETDANLVLHIPMKGAKANKIDVLASDQYLKVDWNRLLYRCLPWMSGFLCAILLRNLLLPTCGRRSNSSYRTRWLCWSNLNKAVSSQMEPAFTQSSRCDCQDAISEPGIKLIFFLSCRG